MLRVTALTIDHQATPLGIGSSNPSYGWQVWSATRGQVQTAYQVQLSGSPALLSKGTGLIWDSGKVTSAACCGVRPDDVTLDSRTRHYWRVRVWDAADAVSGWSSPAWFETGLLLQEDWGADWISAGEAAAPHLRTEFSASTNVTKARLYVTSLGYHELWLNGKKVGAYVLDPPHSRFDTRQYCTTHDVTRLLKSGGNCLGAVLNLGRYDPAGVPFLLLQLEITYRSGAVQYVYSDSAWTYSSGAITAAGWFAGESYDARLEPGAWSSAGFDDSGWTPVDVEVDPSGEVTCTTMPRQQVTLTRQARTITSLAGGIKVIDFAQNAPGWCRLIVTGTAGTAITLRFGELLNGDGTVDQTSMAAMGPPYPTDTYILKGGAQEVWEPRFSWRGFRYVQVEGYPGALSASKIQARVVHTALPAIGEMACSDVFLTRLQTACLWTERGNYQSMPTDCPQREERLGWLCDAHVSGRGMLYNWNVRAAYRKFFQDISDSIVTGAGPWQGAMTDECPWNGWPPESGFPADPWWGIGQIVLLWRYYLHTGDAMPLLDHYVNAKLHIDWLASKAVAYILGAEWNYYGDWMGISGAGQAFLNTAAFHEGANTLALMAAALGETEDAATYTTLTGNIATAFHAAYYNAGTGEYDVGTQTANAIALHQGVVPGGLIAGVTAKLADDLAQEQAGHIATGYVGTRALLDVLTAAGYESELYAAISAAGYPGWRYMLDSGATTIWEGWDNGPAISQNHAPFSSISEWLYSGVAGIRPLIAYPGWEQFELKPRALDGLTWSRAQVRGVRGLVSTKWRLTATGSSRVDAVIPAGAVADLYVPKAGLTPGTVKETGVTVWSGGAFVPGRAGVTAGADAGNWVQFTVGSGSYSFDLVGA